MIGILFFGSEDVVQDCAKATEVYDLLPFVRPRFQDTDLLTRRIPVE